jgi:hypothetical protein
MLRKEYAANVQMMFELPLARRGLLSDPPDRVAAGGDGRRRRLSPGQRLIEWRSAIRGRRDNPTTLADLRADRAKHRFPAVQSAGRLAAVCPPDR